MLRTRSLIFSITLCFAASTAAALPTNYDFLLDGVIAGGFTLDPDLAAPAGLSNVDVTAFSLSVNVGGFGPVSFDLSDITASPPRGSFLDGQLASMTTTGATGLLPDGSSFLLDLTPFIPANVGLIDLTMAGQFNLTIVDIGGGFPDKLGSFGIALSDPGTMGGAIPEPGAALLFAIGVAVCSRRLKNGA